MAKPKLKMVDYEQKLVRLLVPLETPGGVRFSAGELLRVRSTHRGTLSMVDERSMTPGLGLIGARCISKVHRDKVEIVSDGPADSDERAAVVEAKSGTELPPKAR